MTNYKSRNEWASIKTEEEVREQIALRHALMREMVGTLYPSILASECEDLSNLKVVRSAK